MSFELNNIDELVKQKITQKLFSFESKFAGDNLNIFKFIPYCLISNKKFQSKIHKITSEEREAYKTRFFALFGKNTETSNEEINSKLQDLFDDRSITTSDFDEIFPKFSLVNFDALLANILRINAEIYNVFEAADDSKKVDLDDFFYNLSTVDNSLLIPADYVISEQIYKYYHYPKPCRGTLSLHHEESETWWTYLNNIYRTLNEVDENNSNSNVIIEENSSSIVTCLKLLLSLLFTTRKYNSLDTASFVYASGDDGSIHDKVYINLNDLNFTKYSNCVFEDLNNESNNFDIDKYFDGYDNYQSSDEQFSVSDAINECCKFSTFLIGLYYSEVEKKLAEDKYSNLINDDIFINHFAGFIELCKDLRSTFRIIRQVMSKSNGVSLLNGDNREIVIPSYNQFDIICKESVKEVIKDLIAEYLVKTK